MLSILIGAELGSLVERIAPMTSENFLTTFFTGLIGISSYVAGSRLLLRAEGFDARSTRLFGLITTLIVFLLAADVFGLFADLFDSSILRDLAIRIGVDRPMLELPLIVAGLFTACVFFMVAMRLLRAVDAPRVIPDHTVSFARKA